MNFKKKLVAQPNNHRGLFHVLLVAPRPLNVRPSPQIVLPSGCPMISNPADHYMYGSCNRLEKATHNRAKIQELTGFDITWARRAVSQPRRSGATSWSVKGSSAIWTGSLSSRPLE